MPQYVHRVAGALMSDEEFCNISADVLEKMPYNCSVFSVPEYRYVYINPISKSVIEETGRDPSKAIGLHPWEVFDSWKEYFLSAFESVRSSKQPKTVKRAIYGGAGGPTFWDMILIPRLNDESGEVEYICSIGLDVTEDVQSELLDQALNDINSRVTSTHDLGTIMKTAADAGPKAIQADVGCVRIETADCNIAEYVCANNIPSRDGWEFVDRIIKEPFGRNATIVTDAYSDPRTDASVAGKYGIHSLASFPLIAKDERIGHLTFYRLEVSSFSPAQIDFGTKLASSISLAIDNAMLVEDLNDELEHRKKAEADLQKYRLFFKNSRDIMFLAREDGELLEVNDAGLSGYGYSIEEMAGKNIAAFRSPETRDSVARQMKEGLEVGILYETMALRKDGSTFPVEVSLKSAELADKPAVMGVVRDISERKSAEEALKVSELNYRTIFNNVNEAIVVIDGDTGAALSANKPAEEMYGYNQEEFIRAFVGDVSEGSSAYNHEEGMKLIKAAAEEGPQYFEWRAKDSDGRVFWVDVNLKSATLQGRRVILCVIRDISARKEREEELRDSEERFRAVFNKAAVGIVIATPERQILDCNDSYEEMLGYSREELRNMTFRDYTYAGDAGTDAILFEELVCGKRDVYRIEKRYVRKDGSVLWARLNASLVKSETGKPMFVIGMTEDIHDRVQAVEALQSERRRLREILDILPVGVVIADEDGKIVEANEAIKLAWGEGFVKSESISGYTMYKGWWADTGEYLKAEDWAMARAIRYGETSIAEMIDIERFDGSKGTILNSAVPMYDGEGHIVGAIAVVQDITMLRLLESQAAEYAAREAEARTMLQTILDTAPVGIVVVQADGEISYTSEGALRILGSPAVGIVGQPESSPYRLFHTDSTRMGSTEFPLHRSLRHGESIRDLEMIIQRPDGERICVIANCSPIRDGSGNVTSAVGIFTDVTKMSELRREVERNLEREVHFSQMLQQALLPTIPDSLSGYSAASIYIPAFASREIGGDFFDLFETEDGKIGMLIGDVSGKGLEAAAFAAEARSIIHAFAYELSSPAEAITHANSVLAAIQQTNGLFVTVFLVIADPRTGRFKCCGAGHPPAILQHPDGRIELAPFGDLPMGVQHDYIFHERECHFEIGSRIILYTDGITEARQMGEMFGIDGIEQVLRKSLGMEPKAVIEAIVGAAQEWAGDHLRDDTAVMIIKQQEFVNDHDDYWKEDLIT